MYFSHLCVRRCLLVAKNSAEASELLTDAVFQLVVVGKRTSSEYILQRSQEDGSWRVLNRDCREDEAEQATPLVQLPTLCTDWFSFWGCPERRGLDSSPCLAEVIVLTALMSAHTALNCLWHFSRLPLTRSLHCPWRRCRDWSAAARPVTSVLFTALKTMDAASNRPNAYDILSRHASRTSVDPVRTKKFSHHLLPSTYVHNIRHFATVLKPLDWLEQ
jgi:hypothetical protein